MKKVLIIGPFPNPISGVSIANKVVEEIINADLNLIVEKINTYYQIFDEQIGEFSIQKFLFYLRINSSFFKVLKNNIIYITPGQTFFGVLKYALFIVAASALRKELIIHVHGNYLGKEYQSLKGIKRVLFYFLVSRFTKGIVLSNSLKQNLTPFLKDKNIFSLPNFAKDYLYTKDKKFVKDELRIFYLSNLMKEKGIFYLLNALKNLEKNNIIYKAKIAGNIDQNYSKEILKLFTELKNAEYIGIVNGDDKKSLLEWGNIFVLPTFYKMEGQPISILEAMATTNLVVTTNHAVISDVFQDKINGYFVEKNNENSIEKILSYLAANKSELKKIAEYNKRFFLNNFTVDIFKKNLLEIIK